jgi:hypothetical protein
MVSPCVLALSLFADKPSSPFSYVFFDSGSTQPGSPADPTSPTFSSSAGNRASKTSASPSTASTSFRRSSKANTDGGALAGKRMSVAEANSGVAAPGQQQGGNPSAKRALDRIPEPDFAGYLRKKGERYNSWKTRYCVLSGPHLYYLKSENVRLLFPPFSLSSWLIFDADSSFFLLSPGFALVGRQVQGLHLHARLQGPRRRERERWQLRLQDRSR